MKTTVQFSHRELSHVLAALRLWQEVTTHSFAFAMPDEKAKAIHDIATDGHSHELLKPKSIDRLCERINTSEPLRIVVEVSGGVVDPVHVSHEACVTVYDHDNIEAGDEPPIDLEKTTDQLLFTY